MQTINFEQGQQVTVKDGGWTGIIQAVDTDAGVAYIQFPDRPDRLPYACEALMPAMFDQLTASDLTPDEYCELSMKLHRGAHKLFEVGHTLAQVAFARIRDGRGTYDDQADTILWAERARYLTAREELCELASAAAAIVLAQADIVLAQADNTGCETANA